jgi:autotransporter-associated beta strand protein
VVTANGVFDITGVTTAGGATITSLSGSGIVTLGGNTLTPSSAGDTFGGIIDGTGGLTITSGTETLTATNTYSGVTTVNGALVLSTAGSIALSSDVIVNGQLNIATLTAAGASIKSLDGNANGEVILGTKTLTLTSAAGAFAGQITGSGGLTLSSGTETLSGNSNYTGATAINGGTLNVTGLIAGTGSVDVYSGGTLTGAGIVDPLTTTIHSGATFAPGTVGVPGTSMTITGNLAFQSGAIYAVYLNTTTSTFANVTGNASLAGTVSATFATGAYLTKVYTILQSAGLGGTTFASVTATNIPSGFRASLVYSGGDVLLDLNAALPTGRSGLNINQTNVATALDNYFNSGGALPPNFLTVFGLSGGGLANALSQLSGEASVDAEFVAFQQTSQFLNLMLDPYVDGRLGSGGVQPMGYAPEDKPAAAADFAGLYGSALDPAPRLPFAGGWTTWGASYGGANSTTGNTTVGSSSVTTDVFAVVGGMDYHITPDAIVGFALGGGGTNWGLASGMGTGRSDAFQAGAYAATRSGPAYLSAALAFANNWFTVNRGALGDSLRATFAGQSYGARLEGDYRFGLLPAFGVAPYAALQAQAFHTPNYTENDLTNGGFGLSYAPTTATDVRSELGARFDSPTLIDTMPLVLRARVAWAHDWVSDPSLNAAFQLLPGTNFTVYGAAIPQNSALASVGAQLFITSHLSVLAKFDGEFAPGSQTYAGSGTVRYAW